MTNQTQIDWKDAKPGDIVKGNGKEWPVHKFDGGSIKLETLMDLGFTLWRTAPAPEEGRPRVCKGLVREHESGNISQRFVYVGCSFAIDQTVFVSEADPTPAFEALETLRGLEEATSKREPVETPEVKADAPEEVDSLGNWLCSCGIWNPAWWDVSCQACTKHKPNAASAHEPTSRTAEEQPPESTEDTPPIPKSDSPATGFEAWWGPYRETTYKDCSYTEDAENAWNASAKAERSRLIALLEENSKRINVSGRWSASRYIHASVLDELSKEGS